MHKIFVTGNVGQDPQVKSFDNGGKVANFSVADTEKGYKTRDGKEIPDHTEWFRCVVRSSLADVVEKYLKKGMHVEIIGKLRTREYEKDGQKCSTTELVVEELKLPPNGDSNTQSDATSASQSTPQPQDDKGSDLPF